MPRIRFLRSLWAQGEDHTAGTVLAVEEAVARVLVARGDAVRVTETVGTAETLAPPRAEHRDPPLARRRRT